MTKKIAAVPDELEGTTKKRVAPDLDLTAYLAAHVHASGKTNVEIAQALEYERPNVVSMMVNGHMRLPIPKVTAMARVLGVDPLVLLEKVMKDQNPKLWESLWSIMKDRLVSANEIAFLEFMRDNTGRTDPNFLSHHDAVLAMRPIFADVKAKEEEKHRTLVGATPSDRRTAPVRTKGQVLGG